MLIEALAVGLSTGTVALSGRDLVVSGDVGPDTVVRVRAVAPTLFDRFVVRSTGGDTVSSIQVARLAKQSGKPIKIDSYCASACIMFLYINNGKVETNADTILLLHHSPTTMALMTSAHWPAISANYHSQAAVEGAWLKENGHDAKLLLTAQSNLDTKCVFIAPGPKEADYRDAYFISRYQFWVTTPAYLVAHYQLKISVAGTESAPLPERFQRAFPYGEDAKVTYMDINSDILEQDLATTLSETIICPRSA